MFIAGNHLTAVAEKFPELPIAAMSAVPLGKGTLLSYSPQAPSAMPLPTAKSSAFDPNVAI